LVGHLTSTVFASLQILSPQGFQSLTEISTTFPPTRSSRRAIVLPVAVKSIASLYRNITFRENCYATPTSPHSRFLCVVRVGPSSGCSGCLLG